MASYATVDELTAWLTGGDYPIPTGNAATRVLARASELIAANIVGMLPEDPVPATVTAALRDATCAQVEQWADVGESNAIAGYPRDTALSAVGVSKLPDVLAPRAVMLLRAEGLYNPAAVAGVAGVVAVEAV